MQEEDARELAGWRAAGCKSQITHFPGLHSLLISHGVSVPKVLRGKGVGEDFHELRLKEMKEDHGGQYVICTVNASNEPQIKIMSKFGWKELQRISVGCDALHDVIIYGRSL